MLMRWFVVEVSDDREDGIIVGNCKTKAMAEQVIIAMRALSNRNYKTIGPITQNMLEGRMNPEDIELVEAQMEQLEYEQAGGLTH